MQRPRGKVDLGHATMEGRCLQRPSEGKATSTALFEGSRSWRGAACGARGGDIERFLRAWKTGSSAKSDRARRAYESRLDEASEPGRQRACVSRGSFLRSPISHRILPHSEFDGPRNFVAKSAFRQPSSNGVLRSSSRRRPSVAMRAWHTYSVSKIGGDGRAR